MVNPKSWHVKKESDAKISRRWFTRPPIILFAAAMLIVIVTGAAFLASQQAGITFQVQNPSLSLNVTALHFGNIIGEGVFHTTTFIITNNGDVALTLSYATTGLPGWSIVHLATGNPYNIGGTDLNGVLLASGAFVVVYPSLEIVPGGIAGSYSGQVQVNGSV